MKVIVTAGPSYEPIDEVRRLTNFSTGELGLRLSNQLTRAGFEVFCLKGVGATSAETLEGGHLQPFTTNDDLLEHLTRISRGHDIGAVFHVAALCDFKLKQVQDTHGRKWDSPKIESRADALVLHLEPARKVIGLLRPLFPHAIVVGWKYELAGSRQDALAKAWAQLQANQSDACVLNGRAYGTGFGFCTPPAQVRELRNKTEVVEFLPVWLRQQLAARPDSTRMGSGAAEETTR